MTTTPWVTTTTKSANNTTKFDYKKFSVYSETSANTDNFASSSLSPISPSGISETK